MNNLRNPVAVGLMGVLLLVGGVGLYFLGTTAPYRQDESSHVGYMLRLRDGELPELTTTVPLEGGGEDLRAALSRPEFFSVPTIHIANNPPFYYIASIPVMETLKAFGVSNAPLVALRLVNLAGGVAAVFFAYLLGTELGNDSQLVGLVTAALTAGTIAVPLVSSLALPDGPAFAATTAVAWALVRFIRAGGNANAWLLGFCCAAAAALRPMSMAYAAAAGIVALGFALRRDTRRSTATTSLRIGLPTVVLTGWFYVVNFVRYGDPTGSAGVFELIERPPASSFLAALFSSKSYSAPITYLTTEVYGRVGWWSYGWIGLYAIPIGCALTLLGACVLAFRNIRSNSGAENGPSSGGSETHAASDSMRLFAAWVALVALCMVPVLLTARHVSSGGANHPRYLLPVLPVLAAAIAFLSSRVHRYLAAGVAGAAVVALVSRIGQSSDISVRMPNGTLLPSLARPLLSEAVTNAGLAVALIGAVLAVVSIGSLSSRTDDATQASDASLHEE